jgi:hypothetical protein
MVGSSLAHERRKGRAAAVIGFIAAAIVLAGWLLASPHASSPDDGYHLTSIWCSRGFVDGVCLENPGAASWDQKTIVPAQIPRASCFAYEPSVSAACTREVYSTGSNVFLVGSGGNVDGERAGVYYWLMHFFVSDDYPSAFAHIRIANATLVILMIGMTMLVAPFDIRRAVALSWLVSSLPLGLFMVTSLNTTSWGLIGLGTFWANVLTALRDSSYLRRVGASVLGLLGLTMALGSRTEAIGHLAFIGLAILVLEYGYRRSMSDGTLPLRGRQPSVPWRRITTGTAAAAVALLAVMRVPAADYLDGGLFELRRGNAELIRRGFGDPTLALLAEVPQLWTGAFGDQWGLGWLDTPMPSITYIPATAAFVTVLALGLRGAGWNRMLAVSVIGAALLFLPTISLMHSGLVVGEQLQPRHFMVLLFVLSGIAVLKDRSTAGLVLGRGQRSIIVLALSLSHAAALHTNILRYVSGLGPFTLRSIPRTVDLDANVEWWWVDAPAPMTVWLIASVAYAVLAVAVLNLFSLSDRPDGTVRRESVSSA